MKRRDADVRPPSVTQLLAVSYDCEEAREDDLVKRPQAIVSIDGRAMIEEAVGSTGGSSGWSDGGVEGVPWRESAVGS